MLSLIKEIINEKKSFMESADLLLEEAMGELDDAIVLGEDGDDFEMDTGRVGTPPEDDGDPLTVDGVDKGDIQRPDDVEDSENIGDDTVIAPTVDGVREDDVPVPVEGNLPTPVGRQTGQPIEEDDMLSMEIDLATNTAKDILPRPPIGAAATIDGDIMNEPLESDATANIGEIDISESVLNVMNMNLDELFSEAITLDGEAPADDGSTDTVADPPAEDAPAEDNIVTAAVKDKVAEADEGIDQNSQPVNKEELMLKLSNLTKGLEDVKRNLLRGSGV